MEKEDILNYVDQTPGNTNRAVLGSMLNQLIEAGKELPPIETGDAGKLLAVNSGHTAAEWIAPPLVVPLEWNDLETEVSFTKTAGEVIDALLAGRMVQVYDAYGTASSGSMTGYLLKNASWSVGSYSFTLAAPVAIDSNDIIVLTCSTADGYPTATLE